MVQQVLQRFGFTYFSPQSTPLPTGHSLSAPPSDESVCAADFQELKEEFTLKNQSLGFKNQVISKLSKRFRDPSCLGTVWHCSTSLYLGSWGLEELGVVPNSKLFLTLPILCSKTIVAAIVPTSGMGLVLGGRARVVLTGHADASWRSTRSSSVLSSSCEAEIYAGAMAAQELRRLTYLLTDLGEASCSPPVLYVDNKAMLALCQEHRLEPRTKHIALRYFLARELQQRGQLRLAYVASQANTADVFTKALQPCDH
ncbi:unnamed protein product [Closterium sp. NIES-53]